MTIKFYYDILSAPARSIYFALAENGCLDKVELVFVDLCSGKQREPDFLALNPYHTVPTLEDTENGLVLYESGAIMQYLAEVLSFSVVPLPQEPVARWKCLNYMHFHHGKVRAVSRAVYGRIRPLFNASAQLDGAFAKEQLDTGKEWLPIFDKQLQDNGGWIAGSTPTIADLICYGELGYLRSNVYGLDVYNFKPYPNIVAWFHKIEKLNTFKQVHDLLLPFVERARALGPSICQDEQ